MIEMICHFRNENCVVDGLKVDHQEPRHTLWLSPILNAVLLGSNQHTRAQCPTT